MRRIQSIEAIYENGILRPLEPLKELTERCRVRITIEREETNPFLKFAGILNDEEAKELQRIIEEEFELSAYRVY